MRDLRIKSNQMGLLDTNTVMEKWDTLKKASKSSNPDIYEIDVLSCELIAILAELSMRGVEEIDGVSIDLMKDRVWWVVQKHDLLPEYKEEDEEDGIVEILDEWEKYEDEFGDMEIDDLNFYQ